MAKLDLQKLLKKRGWKLADLSKASGISQTVLRHLGDGVFPATPHETRLIMEALARPEPSKSGPKPANHPPGQLDLFGRPP